MVKYAIVKSTLLSYSFAPIQTYEEAANPPPFRLHEKSRREKNEDKKPACSFVSVVCGGKEESLPILYQCWGQEVGNLFQKNIIVHRSDCKALSVQAVEIPTICVTLCR